MTTPQIAKQLFLSEGTVKWYVMQILVKTSSANRTKAVARVMQATRRPSSPA